MKILKLDLSRLLGFRLNGATMTEATGLKMGDKGGIGIRGD